MSAPTPEPLTPERLREIAERAAAATAGPWCTDSAEIHQGDQYVAGALWIGETCRVDDADGGTADAAFVAAARTDVPDLLAEVTGLHAEVDQLRNVELVGVNLALYEERLDTARLRIANRNARERAARWRGNASVLGNAADYAWEQAGELRDELAERPSRFEVLREALAAAEAEHLAGETDTADDRAYTQGVTDAANAIRALLNGEPRIPLVVSRFDVAMEPAPEEDPVLTIGCIAEDGRPVALLLDPEARKKIARWVAPQRKRPPAIPNGVHVVSNGGDGWIVKWRKRRNDRHKDFATRPEADAFARELRETARRLHAERNGGAA
ncbi:hypothetical protein [Streptomyces sp. NPDC001054]